MCSLKATPLKGFRRSSTSDFSFRRTRESLDRLGKILIVGSGSSLSVPWKVPKAYLRDAIMIPLVLPIQPGPMIVNHALSMLINFCRDRSRSILLLRYFSGPRAGGPLRHLQSPLDTEAQTNRRAARVSRGNGAAM